MEKREVRYGVWLQVIGYLFILLFVYAATNKLLDFEQFRMQLHKSPYLAGHANWLSWFVPLSEYVCAGLFLFSKQLRYALYASLILMAAFTLYIGMVLNFSDDIPCSCGGILANLGWTEHLLFNIFFIGLAVVGIRILNRQKKPEFYNSTT